MLNLLIGFTGNIDWRAHLGGLVDRRRSWPSLYDYAGEPAGPDGRSWCSPSGAAWPSSAVLALLITCVAPGHVNLS